MNGLETRGKTRIVLWALLAAALILYGFPFIYLLLTSFKPPLEAIAVPPTVLPTQWTLENYVSALSREGVPAALVNSVITAVHLARCSRSCSRCRPPTPSRGSAPRADASSSSRRS